MNALQIIEKYQSTSDRSEKLKKLANHIKDNPEMQDCLTVLKMVMKENTDEIAKYREVLEKIEIEL